MSGKPAILVYLYIHDAGSVHAYMVQNANANAQGEWMGLSPILLTIPILMCYLPGMRVIQAYIFRILYTVCLAGDLYEPETSLAQPSQ